MQRYESLSYVLSAVKKLDSEGLLILDIDETVLHSGEGPGSESWYDERIKKSISAGMSEEAAVLEANDAWEAMQAGLPVYLTEPILLKLIAECRALGARTLGLTARRPEMASATQVQLKKIGVDLVSSAWETKEVTLSPLVRHVQGVLYGGPLVDKGLAFAEFVEKVGRKPLSIVFVDDRIDHIERMTRHCKRLGIEARCFWYLRPGRTHR